GYQDDHPPIATNFVSPAAVHLLRRPAILAALDADIFPVPAMARTAPATRARQRVLPTTPRAHANSFRMTHDKIRAHGFATTYREAHRQRLARRQRSRQAKQHQVLAARCEGNLATGRYFDLAQTTHRATAIVIRYHVMHFCRA